MVGVHEVVLFNADISGIVPFSLFYRGVCIVDIVWVLAPQHLEFLPIWEKFSIGWVYRNQKKPHGPSLAARR